MAGSVITSRRLVALAALALTAFAVILASTQSTGSATSGGSPYDVPTVTDTDPAPDVVETTIVADEVAGVNIGAANAANLEAYNGTVPGPTFVLNVGDEVIVHYENQLAHPSAIHWHGIELSNGMDGTTFTQNEVEPGGEYLYKFTVDRPGLFWYHPHHHASTNQVFKGLYGMIIVRDPNEAALIASGTLPTAASTKPVVLSDTTVCKAPPGNDNATYDPALPHVSGGALPAQAPPTPKTLCETSPIDEDGNPRGPFAAGDIPNNQTLARFGRTNEGQTVLTNGRNVGGRAGTPAAPGALAPGAQTLPVLAGQGLRLQLLNAASTRYFRLRLTTSTGALVPLRRIGGEGGLIDNVLQEGGVQGAFDTKYGVGEQLLGPGTRADVVAAIPPGAVGTLTLWTQDYQRVGGNAYSNIPTVPVMHLQVIGVAPSTYTLPVGTPLRAATGDPVEVLGPATDNLLNPAVFVPAKPGEVLQNIQLQAVANTELRVDGTFGTHEVPDYKTANHLAGSSRYAEVGERYELTVQNTTGAHHPFHLHGFSIQPINMTKSGDPTFTFPNKEFRDNIDIPAGYTLRFRIRIDDRALADGTTPGGALGRWVFHCHIFFHATNGMLSELVIVNSTGNERPDIDADETEVSVQQGQTATMKGSFADRDGDPVALSASVGTVTDDGGGNWTWTYPTALDDSREVFVTATDSVGQRAQAPFDLVIGNTPPTLTAPGSHTVPSGSPVSFAVSAQDVDAVDPIQLAAGGLVNGLQFTPSGRNGTVSGVAGAPPGTYPIAFSASDGKNAPATATTFLIIVEALPVAKTLTALVDRPERLVRRGITVGCGLSRGSLRTCAAEVRVGTTRVGRATRTLAAAGTTAASVRVPLNTVTRRRIARSLPGRRVRVNVASTEFGAPDNLTATATTRVVAPRLAVLASAPSFGPRRAGLTAAARALLRRIARQVGRARLVTCTAYPDASPLAAASRRLAAARAAAACAALRRAGLRATLRRVASRRLRGSPRTARGRSLNRRVLIVIQR